MTTATGSAPAPLLRRILLQGKYEAATMLRNGEQLILDLLERRERDQIDNVYLMRLEQFYPWPMKSLMTELARFPNAELVWCQEEPLNMGAWSYIFPRLERAVGCKIRYAGRGTASSPAAGSKAMQYREQKALVAQAFEV